MIDLKKIHEAATHAQVHGYLMKCDGSAVRQLVEMVQAAQKDQARYQWLKSRNFPEVFPASPTTSKGWVVTSVDRDWEEQLGDGKTPDEAIDAAMAATKGEEA